ncbi:hypothetical protein, partial [Gardnerella vaginalis]|uniref:hypothetical protein n=1 Tax=Gardnerella vaginalis TaxID=2702 RepID=UPI001E3DA4EE
KPLKNQHSTHITHATRRHQTNNHTQLNSRVCSLFDPFGKQMQEHLPAFVYVFGDFGNKRGIKETKTG